MNKIQELILAGDLVVQNIREILVILYEVFEDEES